MRQRRGVRGALATSAGVAALVLLSTVGTTTASGATYRVRPAARRTAAKGSSSCGTPVTSLVGLPFTGSESFQVGFAKATYLPDVYEINKAGGIMCHKLQVLTFNDQSDAADALIEFDRQLALHPSISFTAGDTTTTPVLLPVATRYKIPFSSVAGLGIYDRSTDPYFYRFAPPDPSNGEAMALWAKRKGYTRIATVFGTDPGSQGDLPGVVNGVAKIHAKLVAQINIVPDQPNYRTDVEKLLAAKPQVIMTETDGPTAATFFRELQQLGKVPPIIGTSATPSASYVGPLAKAIGTSTMEKSFVALVNGVPNPQAPGYKTYAKDVYGVRSQLAAPWQQWVGNAYTLVGYSTDIIFALAMDWAHSTVGSVYNRYIPMVTDPGRGKVVVYDYAQGVAALKKGEKIQYVGALGPMTLNKYHNWFPNEAVQRFSPSAAATTIGVVTTQQIEKLG